MTEVWGWPQWLIAAMYMINILIASGFHGQRRCGKVNAPKNIVLTAIGVWILYKGGFWG